MKIVVTLFENLYPIDKQFMMPYIFLIIIIHQSINVNLSLKASVVFNMCNLP